MRFLRTLILGLFPLLAFSQAADQDWRFAQPGATLVAGVRVDALLQSSILNTVIEQATAKDATMTAMVGMLRGALGGVSEVRISVLDAGAGKDPEVLMLLTGRLDEAAAKALAQGKATVYRVDANTLLMGDADPVAKAVLRLGNPNRGPQNSAVLRGKALADYDLWIAGALPAGPMTAALGDTLHGLALGLSLRDDLRVEVALDTASAEIAEEMVKKARETQKEQSDLGASLVADVDGTTARFRVSVDKSIVVQAIQQQVASGALASQAGGLFGTPESPSASAAKPLPTFKQKEPERKTIRIYGLDEGTREIDPTKQR